MTVKKQFGDLTKRLKALEVTSVEADYSGYGDEFNGIDITYFRGDVEISVADELDNAVAAFFDALIEDRVSGFWNNEGGNGVFAWNVNSGKLEQTHNAVVETYETTEYKGLEGLSE